VHSYLTNWLGVHSSRAWHAKKWRAALKIVFFLLCLRFLLAALRSAGPELEPVVMLIMGGLSLGAWRPCSALFAFTAAVPLLTGLSQTGFLNCTFPPSLVFSSLWMGIAARNLVRKCVRRNLPVTLRTSHQPSFINNAVADERSAAEANTTNSNIETTLDKPPFCSYFPSLVTDAFIAVLMLSLAWQLWRQRDSAELWSVFFNRAVLGYGDPWYFLNSAFLWLQGLFYFEIVYPSRVAQWVESVDSKVAVEAVAKWVRPVFAVYWATMAVFFLMQYIFHIPKGWAGAGFQAPYEDISSFGSVAVSVFIFAVATRCIAPRHKPAIDILGCISLLIMVVASWSRGSWLAGSVFLLLIAVFRLPRLWTTALILIAIAAVVSINANSNRPFWTTQPYLARLVALVRLENPTNKDLAGIARINLYKKAARMIQQHPLVGHGIGSFYLKSVDYAPANDPYAGTPEFAHNAFLQIAAELGVPLAVLFAVLTAWALWRGIRIWIRQKAAKSQSSAHALLALGVTLALGAYLQTQMTANSLNVYVSNQFFFWFLMAAILSINARERASEIEPLAPA
jgi:O-antigen ligase